MKQLLTILSVFAATLCLSVDTGHAAPRGRLFGRAAFRSHGPGASKHIAPPSPYNRYDYYRELYPKYQGSFHSRYFDTIGVPSGDAGLRGNGLYFTPW